MLLTCILIAIGCARIAATSPIALGKNPPAGTSAPLPEAFVSYSIEFSSFPDYAGNTSSPNQFSNNLLNNIGNLTGTKPYVRVGGNTQDYALYDANLQTATYGIINPARSTDFPTTLYISPSYFQSYSSWPDTKFIHGSNLGLGGNDSAGCDTLARVALINMRQYDYNALNLVSRPSLSYSFTVPDGFSDQIRVQRLSANGSDAITGIIWDGYSYNYELDSREPVKLNNVTTGEILQAQNGIASITVPDSSVAVLNFVLE